MTVRRLLLIAVVPLALVGGLASVAGARLVAPAVPIANPSAVRAAFAHGPGRWKVPISPATGNANPAAWPDACKLLNLAELKAVVPGTSSFKTAGQHAQILGGKETPHYASCKYELKGSYDPPASDGYPPSNVQVQINGIADAAAVKQQWTQEEQTQAKLAKKYPDQFGLYKIGPTGKCFWDGTELECINGVWSFWVLGDFIDKTGSDVPALEKAFRIHDLLPLATGVATLVH